MLLKEYNVFDLIKPGGPRMLDYTMHQRVAIQRPSAETAFCGSVQASGTNNERYGIILNTKNCYEENTRRSG